MFSTSGDILNLVLAISIGALTVFLVALIYYVVASLRKVHQVINVVEKGVFKAEELVALVTDKIKGSSGYLILFAELAKQIIKIAKNKYESKSETKKTKSSK